MVSFLPGRLGEWPKAHTHPSVGAGAPWATDNDKRALDHYEIPEWNATKMLVLIVLV